MPVERLEREKSKHSMLPACKCQKKCYLVVLEEMRSEIHEEFWSLDFSARRVRLNGQIGRCKPKDKRGRDTARGKKETRTCSLPSSEGEVTRVCKLFFLSTLRYRTDQIITSLSKAMKGSVVPPPKKRGRHSPHNKFMPESMENIRNHTGSFHPSISN